MAEPQEVSQIEGDLGLPVDHPHLADTTAWSKARNNPTLATMFNAAARDGLIATCELVALELLRSAGNHNRFVHQADTLAKLPSCVIGVPQFERARDVQAALSAQGHHRGVKPVDLLIAAAAEAAHLPLLHYDHDYDLITSVTNQPARWLAPRSTLP